MDATLTKLNKSMTEINQERAAFKNQISGARWAFYILVGIITVGGGGFALRIIDILIALQDAVNK